MEEPTQSKKVRRPAFWEQPAQPTQVAATKKKVKNGTEAEKASIPTRGRATEPGPSSPRQPEQQQPRRPQGKGRPIRFAKKLHANTPFIEGNVVPRVKATVPPTRNDRAELIPPVPDVEPGPEPEPEPVAETDDRDNNKGKEKKRPPPLDLDGSKAAVDSRLPTSPPDRPPRPMRLADEDAITLHHVLLVVNEALRVEMKKHPDVHNALAQDIQGPLRVLGDLGRLVRLLFWSMEQHRKKVWRDRKAAIRVGQPDEPASTPEPWRGKLAQFSTPMRYFTLPSQDTSRAVLEGAQRSENDETRGKDAEGGEGSEGGESHSQGEDEDDDFFSVLLPGVARNGAVDSSDDERDPVWQAFQRSDRRAARVMRATRAVKRNHDTVFNESSSEPESVVEFDDANTIVDYLNIPSPSLRPKFGEDSDSPPDPLDPRRHKSYDIQEQRKEEAAEDRKTRQEAKASRRKARAEARSRAAASNEENRAQHDELREQAQQAATATVKKRLADLEDERDAALQLAKAAVYERDMIDAEREDRAKEMDQIRTLLRELIDKDFPGEVEEEEGDEETGKEEVKESKEEVDESRAVDEDQQEVKASKQEAESKTDAENKEEVDEAKQDMEGSINESHSTGDEKQTRRSTEPESLPEIPSVSDSMRRPSRRSSSHLNRPSAPPTSPTSLPPLTPYPPRTPGGNMTPTIPTVPPTPATPMASWDRQRLVEEVQRILHETAPPPTPLSRQWNQRLPPPSPAPTHRSSSWPRTASTYVIRKARAPLGTGFFTSLLDVLLTVLLMTVRQKDNVEIVAHWIWFAFLAPAYLALTNVALRLWNRRRSRSQSQQPSRSGLADIPENEAILGQPLVATPASYSTISSLHHREARMALALAYRSHTRLAYLCFPRQALAELFVFNFFIFSGLVLAGAIYERNIWLDANNTANAPAQYLQAFVLRYRHDTGSCSTMPSLGPGPYHFCMCMPTFFDPRIITGPLAYLWNVWSDRVLDYLQLVTMWVACGLHDVMPPLSWIEWAVRRGGRRGRLLL